MSHTPPVDSKGAAIEKLAKRWKDAGWDIHPNAIKDFEALLAQEVKRVRLEWFKAGQEDIINHYHHDPEIRRAVKAATLKARKAGLV